MTTRPQMLIFGARGFVGGWLASAAGASYRVSPAHQFGSIDISDASACRRVIDESRADLVFLLAAISDIDRCEREPALAEQVNVRGPENIARACKRAGARLLFTSSGAVFDGTRRSYVESDPVSPVNTYGRS